jgi:2-polyprenyl-3-methyl-5-hydroxy-6-metoxy-1,4-benzoquinol methylase
MNALPSKPSQSDSVSSVMKRIREKIAADIELNKDRQPAFNPYKADHDTAPQAKAGELLYSEELKYLNERWSYAHKARGSIDAIQSHRGGLLGKFIVKVKRKIAVSIWDSILKPYFEEEKDFQANLVRFLNSVSKYVDHRDAANFWELIRKIDVDITNALERIERIAEDQRAERQHVQRQVQQSLDLLAKDLVSIRESVAHSREEVATVDRVAKGLESIVARSSKNNTLTEASSGPIQHDQSYLILENRFRGSEDEISRRVAIYPQYFKEIATVSKKPVLEIGGGRGELQTAFKLHAIDSYSVDIDPAMVAAGVEKGIKTLVGDGIAHLASLEDGSLSGIIAVQVVEHLTQKQLQDLFTLAKKKLVSGGRVIFETINPRSVVALSSNYFRDPTHVWPLHPDTLSFQMNLFGLKTIETKFLSPVSVEAGIMPIEEVNLLSPQWQDILFKINRNFSRLHELLYGHQDYCVVAES